MLARKQRNDSAVHEESRAAAVALLEQFEASRRAVPIARDSLTRAAAARQARRVRPGLA